MWNRFRDWYIAAIGLCLIGGGLFIAARQPSDGGPKTDAATTRSAALSPKSEAVKAPNAPSEPSAQAPANSAAPQQQMPAAIVPAAPDATAPSQAAPTVPPPAANQRAAQNTPATVAAPSAAPASQSGPASGGDAAAGKLVFRKCQVCHSLEPGKNVLGPSLAGIVGHKSGAEPNYAYSPAMKDANLTWDAKTLDAYLDDPQKLVPGNKMPFPGLKTPQDRSDLIAYLATPAASAAAQPSAPPAAAAPAAGAAPQAQQNAPAPNIGYVPDAKFTLRSGIAEGRMVYIGVGGSIDGKVNPVLTAAEGQVVQLTLINGEGAEHDIVFPDQDRNRRA